MQLHRLRVHGFRWIRDSYIAVNGNNTAVIDHEDDELAEESWWWDGRYLKGDLGYLHRRIVSRMMESPLPEGMFVDHIDGNPLNNRRGNLRLVTKQQNAANARSRGGKSKYRGVHQQKSGRWAAQISKAKYRLCLGTYDTEEEAAAAYDEAAKSIHGEFARLNLEPVENSGRRGFCGLAGKE